MKYSQLLHSLVLSSILLALTACYELVHKRSDVANIQRQFHLPDDVSLIAFDSSPKEAGWFGREGLSIMAVVQFEDAAFEKYKASLGDKSIWVPVPYLHYSPDRGKEYSEASLSWRELPLSDWASRYVEGRFRHWSYTKAALGVKRGLYYCSALVTSRGEKMKHNPAAYYWHTNGRACLEIPEGGSAVVWTLGVLDEEKKRLHAFIGFSG